MCDETDIGLIDTHTESNRGNHHHALFANEPVLIGFADGIVEARVIRQGIDAMPGELRSRYLQKIMPMLTGLNITVPVAFNAETKCWEPNQGLPWERWQAVSRRLE